MSVNNCTVKVTTDSQIKMMLLTLAGGHKWMGNGLEIFYKLDTPGQFNMRVLVYKEEGSLANQYGLMMCEVNELETDTVKDYFNSKLYDTFDRVLQKNENIYSLYESQINGSPLMNGLIECPSYKTMKIILQGDVLEVEGVEFEKFTYFDTARCYSGLTIDRIFIDFLAAKYILDEDVPMIDRITKGQMVNALHDQRLGLFRKFINNNMAYKHFVIKMQIANAEGCLRKAFAGWYGKIVYVSVREETLEVLNLILEVNWWLDPEQMKRHFFTSAVSPATYLKMLLSDTPDSKTKGLLECAFQNSRSLSTILDWMTAKLMTHDSKILRKVFKYLLKSVFTTKLECGEQRNELIVSLIAFQDTLWRRNILSKETLRCTIMELEPESGVYWNPSAVGYLKFLKEEHREMLHNFLQKYGTFVWRVLLSKTDGHWADLLLLFQSGPTANSKMVFDIFVAGVFNFIEDTTWPENRENLQSYLKFLQGHLTNWDSQTLQQFQNCLEEYTVRCEPRNQDTLESDVMVEFFINQQQIISLTNILPKLKLHEDLSLEENYSLWGERVKLKMVLDTCATTEQDKIKSFRFRKSEELTHKLKKVLDSIRFREWNSSKEMIRIIRVRRSYQSPLGVHSVLTRAVVENDQDLVNIFSSWITSAEIFVSMMEEISAIGDQFDAILTFVKERFPQYLIIFFELCSTKFTSEPLYMGEIFNVIFIDEKIADYDVLSICNLRNEAGDTILHNIIKTQSSGDLEKWLTLLAKRLRDPEDIEKVFSNKNDRLETPIDQLQNIRGNTMKSLKRSQLMKFAKMMKLKGLEKRIKKR